MTTKLEVKNCSTILIEKLQKYQPYLSSGKINKYEYLTGEEILLSNQKQIVEQAKFAYSPLGKAFEKQILDVLKTLKPKELESITGKKSDDKGKLSKCKWIFKELSSKRLDEIKNINKQIDFNNLVYYFTTPGLALIKFIRFKVPIHIYNDIKNGNAALETIEENQKQFKLNLREITKGNPKYRKKDQLSTIKNIINLYNSREKVIKLFNYYI